MHCTAKGSRNIFRLPSFRDLRLTGEAKKLMETKRWGAQTFTTGIAPWLQVLLNRHIVRQDRRHSTDRPRSPAGFAISDGCVGPQSASSAAPGRSPAQLTT